MRSAPMVCPLCAGRSGEIPGAGPRVLAHCAQCDLVFVPREEHDSPEQERARYETHQNTIDNAGYVSMFERFISLLVERGRGIQTIVDYGCGPGPVLVELLRRRGFEAVGYDPFFAPDADMSGPFDAVVSTETFEHFASPGLELQRISRMIRPGGILAVMTLFHPGPDAEKLGNWWYARDPTHVSFYSPATARWIAGRFNYDVVFCDDRQIVLFRRRPDEDAGKRS